MTELFDASSQRRQWIEPRSRGFPGNGGREEIARVLGAHPGGDSFTATALGSLTEACAASFLDAALIVAVLPNCYVREALGAKPSHEKNHDPLHVRCPIEIDESRLLRLFAELRPHRSDQKIGISGIHHGVSSTPAAGPDAEDVWLDVISIGDAGYIPNDSAGFPIPVGAFEGRPPAILTREGRVALATLCTKLYPKEKKHPAHGREALRLLRESSPRRDMPRALQERLGSTIECWIRFADALVKDLEVGLGRINDAFPKRELDTFLASLKGVLGVRTAEMDPPPKFGSQFMFGYKILGDEILAGQRNGVERRRVRARRSR